MNKKTYLIIKILYEVVFIISMLYMCVSINEIGYDPLPTDLRHFYYGNLALITIAFFHILRFVLVFISFFNKKNKNTTRYRDLIVINNLKLKVMQIILVCLSVIVVITICLYNFSLYATYSVSSSVSQIYEKFTPQYFFGIEQENSKIEKKDTFIFGKCSSTWFSYDLIDEYVNYPIGQIFSFEVYYGENINEGFIEKRSVNDKKRMLQIKDGHLDEYETESGEKDGFEYLCLKWRDGMAYNILIYDEYKYLICNIYLPESKSDISSIDDVLDKCIIAITECTADGSSVSDE